MSMNWYAVQTYSGHENKVKSIIEKKIVEDERLSEKIGQVFIPTHDILEIQKGKKVKVSKRLYPGYVLVEMDLNDATQNLVINIQGVIKFVGSGKKPQPIREDEIGKILGHIEEAKTAPAVGGIPFELGEIVEVTDGPFSEFTGSVEELFPDKGKVKVVVSLFGRPTPIELDYTQLKSV